jgi:purine-binding chemotaxis protein CheW
MTGHKTKSGKAAKTLDWESVHRRLAATEEALAREFAPEPAERAAILRRRAAEQARIPAADVAPGELLELLEFVLAGEHYALEFSYVREVCPLKELTPLPCVPPFVLGITNLRGQIVSVLDFKRFFDLPRVGLSDLNKVIVLADGGMEFGLLADAIVGLRQLPRSMLQPPLPTLSGIRADYLKGVTVERLIVLEAARLIHDDGLLVDQEVGA